MQRSTSTCRSPRVLVVVGVLLGGLMYIEALRTPNEPPNVPVPRMVEVAQAVPVAFPADESFVALYKERPLAYLQQARQRYHRSVHDYVCRFTKQEMLGSKLSKQQVAEVKFREGPFSVFMHVIENPGRARRLLYVENRIIENGQEQVIVEPEGPIARLLIRSVRRPIDGRGARKESRRTIREFGIARSLDLVIKYAEMSKEQGILDLRYVGEGEIDGRPTHIIERRLPFDDGSGQWPDALVVVHMDQEWNLPVACFSYADSQGAQLLGKYLYTDVNFNVGLQEADFDPKTYGL